MKRHVALTASFASILAACAASKAPPGAPATSPPSGYGQASSPSAYGKAAPTDALSEAAPPPPAPPARTHAEPPNAQRAPATSSSPSAGAATSGTATSRALALQSASNDMESSQRELDVAAGDCRNACRALGSMDRATGRLCELAQGPTETRRCDDAKIRVYSARDRVKSTCGACPGGPSVERTSPIPSVR